MFNQLLENMVPILGAVAVQSLRGELDELVGDAQEPWKKAVLGLVADGVSTFGPRGIQVALDALMKLGEGGNPPDLEWANLEVVSDILAHMQNAEAERRSETQDFILKVGKVLGVLFGGFLKGLIASL